MSDWIHFMRNSVPPKAVGIVCADLRFVEFLTEGHKPEVKENARPPLTDLPEEPRFFQFRPILTRMAAAYLSVLHGTTPDPNTVAAFLADVALDPLSHQFLTLTGMAHSAQDIIVFLKHNTGIDMVLAAFPAGTEMFTLSKTEATPADVDPAQMGLDYFSTESSFKELPKPYRVCFEPVGNGNPRSFGLYMIPERGGFPHDYQTTAL
jgi:hypothetical protein